MGARRMKITALVREDYIKLENNANTKDTSLKVQYTCTREL